METITTAANYATPHGREHGSLNHCNISRNRVKTGHTVTKHALGENIVIGLNKMD